MIVREEDVEAALDTLHDGIEKIGRAKERAVKAGHMVKHVEALVMKTVNSLPVSAQTREARASQDYLDALTEDALAQGELEIVRAEVEAAEKVIAVWQSQIKANVGPRP